MRTNSASSTSRETRAARAAMDSKASDDVIGAGAVVVPPPPSALAGDGRIEFPARITAVVVVVVARKARRHPYGSTPSSRAYDDRADDDDDEDDDDEIVRLPRGRIGPFDLDDDDVNAMAEDVDVARRNVATEMILRVIVMVDVLGEERRRATFVSLVSERKDNSPRGGQVLPFFSTKKGGPARRDVRGPPTIYRTSTKRV